MYQNSPRKMVENFGLKWSKYSNQVLGGEAAMWSEQVSVSVSCSNNLIIINVVACCNFFMLIETEIL